MSAMNGYLKIVVACYALLGSAVVGTALYMDPVVGELTRLGGYLENDYGWRLPQEHFPEPLFERIESLDEFTRPYDVVVLGDSFSADKSHGWQNYFVAETGLSLLTINMNKVSPEQLMGHPAFRRNPPRLFVYESAERNTVRRNPSCDGAAGKPDDAPGMELPFAKRQSPDVVMRQRPAGSGSLRLANLSSAVNYLKKQGLRSLLDRDTTEVRRFSLVRKGLFSSRRDDELLIITRDYRTKGVSEQQIETVGCRLLEIQQAALDIGVGAFAAMIFPDKTALYSPYIGDPPYRNEMVGLGIEDTSGLVIAKLSRVFAESIREGAVDLYLPNDSHCGFLGYRIAARELLRVLREHSEAPLAGADVAL